VTRSVQAGGEGPPEDHPSEQEDTLAPTGTLPQLLTIDQLAEQLNVSIRHVRRLVAERRVPYLKVGKFVRFDPAEIAGWLDERRVAR
jgi:excisionase family DNA binding protein